jgi:hypothetical protein
MQALSTNRLILGNSTLSNTGQSLYVNGQLTATPTFTKSTVLYNKDGIADGIYNFTSWRAPFNCTVTGVHGMIISGSVPTGVVNVSKNFSQNHLSSNLVINQTGAWISSGIIQNANYNQGDTLQFNIVAVSGSPLSLTVQVDFVGM